VRILGPIVSPQALLMASRQLNGNQYDLDAFKKEISAAYGAQRNNQRTPASDRRPVAGVFQRSTSTSMSGTGIPS
jgi:hypothetical protein